MGPGRGQAAERPQLCVSATQQRSAQGQQPQRRQRGVVPRGRETKCDVFEVTRLCKSLHTPPKLPTTPYPSRGLVCSVTSR